MSPSAATRPLELFPRITSVLLAAALAACGGSGGESAVSTTPVLPASGDPGTAEWEPIPPSQVAEACGLAPDLLAAADAAIDRSWAVVRYGQLCHEHYPEDREQVDERTEIFSATKTFGALVTGIAAYQTHDLLPNGRKTGPLSDEDRVDHWLDEFSFHPDAQIAHVLAMVAHNQDLGWGAKEYRYDLDGTVQINRLSDVLNTVVRQDPERLGGDLEQFTQRHVYAPLGMRDSVWSGGDDDKIFGFSLSTTVRDMARIGLLMLHGGVWSGERILAEDWVYKMTHPAFEDSNLSYGYLTWLISPANDPDGETCAPWAVHASYPHGLSEAADCGAEPALACEQQFDAGMWYAAGLFGQYIVGHPGLDLVLVVKNFDPKDPIDLWHAVRPALVALDPTFQGDEAAFCASYSRGDYAPDL
jgi:CubicO group peptidase (beta-lactamase class C family)